MDITQVNGYNAEQYNPLINEAQTQGVTQKQVDDAIAAAMNQNKTFTEAVNSVRDQLPELAAPSKNVPLPSSRSWIFLPSPAALIVSLLVTQLAEQRQQNRTLIFQQGMAQADLIEQQGDKIRQGAITRFACAVTGAAISIAGSALSLGFSAAGVGRNADTGKLAFGAKAETIDNQFTASFSQAISGLGSSTGQIFNSGGELGQGIASAEQKELEADAERLRTAMEQTKQTNEALRDTVAKGLDFMSSMQANQNQTRTKILG